MNGNFVNGTHNCSRPPQKKNYKIKKKSGGGDVPIWKVLDPFGFQRDLVDWYVSGNCIVIGYGEDDGMGIR